MTPRVFTLRKTDGTEFRVNRVKLELLRMQMDWQLRAAGIDPASVTLACNLADGEGVT